MPENAFRPKSVEAGFSLIENLVTLFILTVGLLGLAGLQATSLRINHQAFAQHKAVSLALNIADRMRANPEGVDGGFYSLIVGSSAVLPCYTSSGCSPQLMAQNDIWEWNQLLQSHLPGGYGIVCADDTPADGGTGFASSTATSIASQIVTLASTQAGTTPVIQGQAADAQALAQQAEAASLAGNAADAADLAKQSAEKSQQVLDALFPMGMDSDPVAQTASNQAQRAISSASTASSVASASDAQTAISAACSNSGSVYSIWIVWDTNNDGTLDNPFVFDINGDLSYMMTFEP